MTGVHSMNKTDFLSFNRRYLATGTVIFLISVFFLLRSTAFSQISQKSLVTYSVIFLAISLSLTVVLCLFIFKDKKNSRLVISIFLCVLIIIVSIMRVSYIKNMYKSIDLMLDSAEDICGTVCETPTLSNSEKSYGIILTVSEISGTTLKNPVRVLCYIPKDSGVNPPDINDSIRCKKPLRLSDNPSFDGAFDFREYLYQNKTLYGGYSKNFEYINTVPLKHDLIYYIKAAGRSIRKCLLNSTELPEYNDNEKALLQGITVGDRSMFSDSLYSDYANSGLIHIAAVSGMHISFLFAFLSFFLLLIRTPRKLIIFIAVPILILFAAAAQFTPSVNRAVIMMLIMLLAGALGRRNDSITALSVAALILVFDNPYCLTSYSFLLSFGSTLGILVYTSPLCERLSFLTPRNTKNLFSKSIYHIVSYIILSLSMSFSATVGTAYFSARFFSQIHWGSIFANIFISPAVAIAFIGGWINAALSAVFPVGASFLAKYLLNPVLSYMNTVSKFFSNEIFSISVPTLSIGFFPVYIVLCIGLYFIIRPKPEK